MPATIDTAAAWAGIIVCIVTVGAVVGGFLRWWIHKEIASDVARIRESTEQLRHNGGDHLADSVARIEAVTVHTSEKVDSVDRRLSYLEGGFAEYVRSHPI